MTYLKNEDLENLRKNCKDLKLDEKLIYSKIMLHALNKKFVDAFKKKFVNFLAIDFNKKTKDSLKEESKKLSFDVFSDNNAEKLVGVFI